MQDLIPQTITLANGQSVALFPDPTLEYVKVDFTFDAGTVRQSKLLLSGAANSLCTEGTTHRSPEEIAEFLDFRGIILDRNTDFFGASISVYMLRKYAADMLPLLYEMFTSPLFAQQEYEVYMAKRKQQLLANLQKTRYVARNLFYEGLFGCDHPMGCYATEEDIDKVRLEDVKTFYKGHYALGQAEIVISGGYDDKMLSIFNDIFGHEPSLSDEAWNFDAVLRRPIANRLEPRSQRVEGTVQSTIRMGSVLPYAWNSIDYSRFMVLNTVLGGYFGSRLMSNIREDKGYTYGIYSQTVLQRGSIVFFLSAEVGNEVCQPALEEIRKELRRLCEQPVEKEELERVTSYMEGDFLRSIDGIFERSERYRQMRLNGITEEFTDNYFEALRTTTPDHLQALAKEVFVPERLLEVVVGQ